MYTSIETPQRTCSECCEWRNDCSTRCTATDDDDDDYYTSRKKRSCTRSCTRVCARTCAYACWDYQCTRNFTVFGSIAGDPVNRTMIQAFTSFGGWRSEVDARAHGARACPLNINEPCFYDPQPPITLYDEPLADAPLQFAADVCAVVAALCCVAALVAFACTPRTEASAYESPWP
jgi:hypothetical protein